ncbi:MAG: hypothetical protein IJT24_01320 [Lachnospiraceae bacterium]|nr:hypothetical protein [Lachnospiraceae bacterium]
MEGYSALGEINKNAEQLSKEAKLKAVQEQVQNEGLQQDAVRREGLPEDAKEEAPGSLIREKAAQAVKESLEKDRFAAPEGLIIKQADEKAEPPVRLQNAAKKEQVKEAVDKKLADEFAPQENLLIKQPKKSKNKAAKPDYAEEERREDRRRAVRESFKKVGEKADDIWILLGGRAEVSKKDSIYYRRLRDAAERVRELSGRLERDAVPPGTDELLEAMQRLSETARIYYDMHRGRQYTDKGKDRKNAVRSIKELTERFYDEMGRMQSREGLDYLEPDARFTVEEGVKAHSRLRELVKHYGKWKKHFAFQEADERANIRAKAELFAVYEHEMDIYRSVYRYEPNTADPEIMALIKEARFYKIQNRVIADFEKNGEMKKDEIREISREQVDRADYREKSEEELSPEEIDRDISPAQLRAIERIDRWFIRNYNNGGLVGRPLNIKNHHGEIVSALMSRTKRERLFIYYLIETGARKDPKVFDAYASQTDYTPSLDKLKGQMLASKLKLMSRLVGGYVYMHKLSEAMQINRDYRELIKDSAKLTRLEGRKESEIKDPAELRTLRLKQAYISVRDYKEKAEKCRRAKGEARAALEAEVRTAEAKYRRDLQALIDADEAVGEASRYGGIGAEGEKSADRLKNREDNNRPDFRDNLDTYVSVGSNAASNAGIAVNVGAVAADVARYRHGGVSWRLKDSALANANKYAKGYTASAISALGHAMTVLYGIYNLYENGAKMHAGDIGKEAVEILKAGAETYTSVRTGAELVSGYGSLAKSFDSTKVVEASGSLKTAGMITSGAGVLLNGYVSVSGALDCANASKASAYLSAKLEASKELKNAPGGETPEQKAVRLQKLKEARYEKNMLQLVDDISRNKTRYAGLQTIASGIGFASLLLPGLGSTLVSIGGMGVGVAFSILKAVDMSTIKTKLFDAYFDFDSYMVKVREKLAQKGQRIHDEKEFAARMRRKLAAEAGYADMPAAADQIAKRYADQICARLFGGEAMGEDEKKGYIQMIKGFGLPYNEEKRIPGAKLLARRMTGR